MRRKLWHPACHVGGLSDTHRCMRIYIDFDDVLCETAQGLSVLAREMFGRDVPFEQICSFDLRVAFALDELQYEALMVRAHESAFLLSLPEVTGCVSGVLGWLQAGHDVVVVTGRPSSCHQASRAWLQQHGLGALTIWYVDKYNRVRDVMPGAPPMWSMTALLQEPFDVAIDDSPMVLDVLQTRAAGRTIVFDRPWNRGYGCPAPRVRRCCGWQELANFFS